MLAPRERFKELSVVVSFCPSSSVTVVLMLLVLVDVSIESWVGLKFIVLNELTPSIFDKVTSINLSTANPFTSVVDLKNDSNEDKILIISKIRAMLPHSFKDTNLISSVVV